LIKHTTSLCPQCCTEIPATVTAMDQAIMTKTCPTHGRFDSVVENSGVFYKEVQQNLTGIIYHGLIIDVTYKCNLRCKWCFQDLQTKEPTFNSIMALVNESPNNYPIILSGGEPTLRKDLAEIVTEISKNHPVMVLTNGYRINWNLPCEWVLSNHDENREQFESALIAAKAQFRSIIFTIDDIDQLPEVMVRCMALRECSQDFRIHMASSVGQDSHKGAKRYFVSDMIKTVMGLYPGQVTYPLQAMTQYVPLTVAGLSIYMIAWSDITNIDLKELDCPTWYHDHTGTRRHLVTSLIHNGFHRSN
jgi:hypothetical protein